MWLNEKKLIQGTSSVTNGLEVKQRVGKQLQNKQHQEVSNMNRSPSVFSQESTLSAEYLFMLIY